MHAILYCMFCTFCRIVQRDLPADIFYEDERVIAFVPLNPTSPGHLILAPKAHIGSFFEMDTALVQHFAVIMRDLSRRLIEENQATGINLLNANGRDAQQSVMHAHFHLVPRYANDGLDLWIQNNESRKGI